MIHGPGCPVCVLPIGRVDLAIQLALQSGVILCTYGDCLRVPASGGLSLLKAKALASDGGDVRMVYSPADAVRIAQANPGREVVFFAIGFETTTPPTALVIRQAAQLGLRISASSATMCSRPRPSPTFSSHPRCGNWAPWRWTASSARRMSPPSSAASPMSSLPRNIESPW